MVTVYEDSERIFRALKAGASGYLLKSSPPQQLLEAVRDVHGGGAPMSSHIARQVVRRFHSATMSYLLPARKGDLFIDALIFRCFCVFYSKAAPLPTQEFHAWQKGNGFDQLPGHGPRDFKPWLQALAAIGYHGWMTPFVHGEEPAEKIAQVVAKARVHLDDM